MKKLPGFRLLWQALQSRHHASPDDRETLDGELPNIDERITDTGYYNDISFKYHSAQVVCMMLLAVFLAVTLMTDAKALSAENLIYFVKDLSTTITEREQEARDTYVYSADENNVYSLYREGLVVLGKQKLTVFTATGREAYSYLLAFQHPALASSGRYLAAYDMGGSSVNLYNSFTCVKEITTDHALRTVALSDTGYYCLVTAGSEYASEVLLYNDRHHMINRYRLKEYTIGAQLKRDGSEVMLVSVATELGRMVTHIDFATPGKSEWAGSFEVKDAYPVACRYTEEGNISLLSTDAWYLFSREGKELNRYPFSSSEIVSYRESGDRQILICRDHLSDLKVSVLVFDKTGHLEYNVSVSNAVRDTYYADGVLAVLCDNALLVWRDTFDDTPQVVELKGSYHTLLACNNEEFFLCGNAKAIAVKP